MMGYRRFTFAIALTAVLIALATVAGMGVFSPVYAQSSVAENRAATAGDYEWYRLNESGEAEVDLYFFWSETCPHCKHAHPFILSLPDELPWLNLHALELNTIPENTELYIDMAASVGEEAMFVPAFIYCGKMEAGYDEHETTGEALKQDLIACRQLAQQELTQVASVQEVVPTTELPRTTTVNLPVLGEVAASSLSLPALTLLIAGVDSVNPCAIFVLMFLLSLMVHAQSRTRMLIIGLVFVVFSGLIYFVFMSAWLNVFLLVGELKIITVIAGLVAMIIALINIKDFFFFKQGVSLSIPESAKPGLYARTRNLVHAGSLGAMIFSTALLAIAANSYELLCTAGFPMVYTRILTMADLSNPAYYGFLAAYNAIYVVPLMIIVVAFSFFLGSRKLGEDEGRALKLVSGMMMLMLGFVLVFAPQSLSNMAVSVGIVFTALAISGIVIFVDRKFYSKRRRRKK